MQFFEMSHSIGRSGMLLCFINPFMSQMCCRSFSGACSCGRCVWGVVGTAGAAEDACKGVLYFYTLTKIAFYAVAICVTGCLELIEVKEEGVGEQAEAHWKNGMCQDDKRNSI